MFILLVFCIPEANWQAGVAQIKSHSFSSDREHSTGPRAGNSTQHGQMTVLFQCRFRTVLNLENLAGACFGIEYRHIELACRVLRGESRNLLVHQHGFRQNDVRHIRVTQSGCAYCALPLLLPMLRLLSHVQSSYPLGFFLCQFQLSRHISF